MSFPPIIIIGWTLTIDKLGMYVCLHTFSDLKEHSFGSNFYFQPYGGTKLH